MDCATRGVPVDFVGMRSKPMRPLVAIALLLAAQARAQTGQIDIPSARRYFDELRQLSAADRGNLWGRKVAGPIFFVDPRSRSIVASEPDSNGLLRSQDGVWIGTLPKEINAANTAIDIHGKRWTMVMWPVSDNRYARQRLLMHESFHRIQPSIGIPASDPSNAHLATRDGRIWTRLEWRALTEALFRAGDARKSALKDALTFRARRRMLSPAAAEDERRLELSEGLAEYTGYMLGGLPRSALADRVAVQLAQSETQESFVRSFAYASGPAYALLLDASGIPWRPKLDSTSDLSAMAFRAYGIGGLAPLNAESLIDRYDGSRMVADEKARDTKRAENEGRLRALFVDGPTLTLSVAGSFAFSFDPNGAVPLPGLGTVYESSRITDDWGVLEVSSGGVMFLRRADGAITGIVVPKPSMNATTIKGDGWQLTLANGWSAKEGAKAGSYDIRKN